MNKAKFDKRFEMILSLHESGQLRTPEMNRAMLSGEVSAVDAFRASLEDEAVIERALGETDYKNDFKLFLLIAGHPLLGDESGHPDKSVKATANRMLEEGAADYYCLVEALHAEGVDEEKADAIMKRYGLPFIKKMVQWMMDQKIGTCEYCGDLFVPRRKTARFCGDRCQKAARRALVRATVDLCGHPTV